MISICVTVKNRSRFEAKGYTLTLFPNMVRSVRKAVEATGLPTELVVADWQSDDWPLSEWIAEAAGPVPVRIVQVPGLFSRGGGRNAAGLAAGGTTLLFIDADMLVSTMLLSRSAEVVAQGKSFFPVCFSYRDTTNTLGWWRWTGKGNCAVSRETFMRMRWPATRPWGGEDERYHNVCARITETVREEVLGFYHQWHPNDRTFKDRYVVKDGQHGGLRSHDLPAPNGTLIPG